MLKPQLRRVLGRMDIGLYRPSKFVAGQQDFDASKLPEVEQVVDLGVSYGTPWLYNAFPKADLVLIDPVPEELSVAEYLVDRNYVFIQAACGSTEGEATLNLDGDHSGRSSLMERTAYSETGARTRKSTVPVRTLDSIVAEHLDFGRSLGVKIDTEGYELEILKGAEKTLQSLTWLICEVSVKERFHGGYRFEELLDLVRSFGLTVSDVVDAPRNIHGDVEFVDLAFTRR